MMGHINASEELFSGILTLCECTRVSRVTKKSRLGNVLVLYQQASHRQQNKHRAHSSHPAHHYCHYRYTSSTPSHLHRTTHPSIDEQHNHGIPTQRAGTTRENSRENTNGSIKLDNQRQRTSEELFCSSCSIDRNRADFSQISNNCIEDYQQH